MSSITEDCCIGTAWRGLAMAALALGLGACSSQTEDLLPVPPGPEEIREKAGDPDKLLFTAKVDILFVVDDSISMSGHQQNMAANIDQFIREITRYEILDYNIGVITTDMRSSYKSGRLQGTPLFVTKNTPNMEAALANNLKVGTRGSTDEPVFDPVIAALSPPIENNHNKDFYRPDAYLATVFITDAEDTSKVSPDYFYDFLLQLKHGDPRKIIPYGVIIPVGADSSACRRDPSGEPVRTEAFINMAGGIFFSLCDPDFGSKLAGLGKDLSERIGNFVPLKQVPDVTTLRVTYGTQVIPNHPRRGWTYVPDRVGLLLGTELELEPQPEGTELEVYFLPADAEPRN